jgi:hypothetical protein
MHLMLQPSGRRRRRAASTVAGIALLVVPACRSVNKTADGCPEAALSASASVAADAISLELKDQAVDDVLQKFAAAAGKPIAIDADAQAAARCARISLLTGGAMPTAAALELLTQALAPAGFSFSPSGQGLVLQRRPDQPLPETCRRATDSSGGLVEPGPASELTTKFAASVKRISDTEFELPHASIELLLENQSVLMRTARIVPQILDGKPKGIRVFGIRASSPLAVLGLKNGDAVLRLQGHSLSNPDQALEAYAALRQARTVELELERQGTPMKLTYRITEP